MHQPPLRPRPLYETTAHLIEEDKVAVITAGVWGCDQRKLDAGRYRADRAFSWHGRDLCVAEVKCRKWQYGAGDGLFLSQAKVMAALAAAAELAPLAGLVVRLLDHSIWAASLDAYERTRPPFSWGRLDRNDGLDIGATLVFPWPAFTRLA